MKKILLLLLVFISIESYSQKLSVGLTGGYDIASFADKNDNSDLSISHINVFNIGGIAEYNWAHNFYIQSGLLFSQKGTNESSPWFGFSGTIKLSYLDIPVNLEYKTNLNKQVKALLGAGFYVSRGISGTQKGTDSTNLGTTVVNSSVHFTNNSTDNLSIQPFDFGFDAFAGIEWKGFQLKFNYSRGLTNMYPVGTTKFFNQTIGFSAGYLVKIK